MRFDRLKQAHRVQYVLYHVCYTGSGLIFVETRVQTFHFSPCFMKGTSTGRNNFTPFSLQKIDFFNPKNSSKYTKGEKSEVSV